RVSESRSDRAVGKVLHHDIVQIAIGHGCGKRMIDAFDIRTAPGICAAQVEILEVEIANRFPTMENQVVAGCREHTAHKLFSKEFFFRKPCAGPKDAFCLRPAGYRNIHRTKPGTLCRHIHLRLASSLSLLIGPMENTELA